MARPTVFVVVVVAVTATCAMLRGGPVAKAASGLPPGGIWGRQRPGGGANAMEEDGPAKSIPMRQRTVVRSEDVDEYLARLAREAEEAEQAKLEFVVDVGASDTLGLKLNGDMYILDFVPPMGLVFQKAGAKVGDKVVAINDVGVLDKSLSAVASLVRTTTAPRLVRVRPKVGERKLTPHLPHFHTFEEEELIEKEHLDVLAGPVYSYSLHVADSDFSGPAPCAVRKVIVSPSEYGCSALQGRTRAGINDLEHTFVVVRRGHCSFFAKGKNVQDSGAAGMIVVNSEEGVFPMGVEEGGTHPVLDIPAVMISKRDGDKLLHSLRTERDHLRVRFVTSMYCVRHDGEWHERADRFAALAREREAQKLAEPHQLPDQVQADMDFYAQRQDRSGPRTAATVAADSAAAQKAAAARQRAAEEEARNSELLVQRDYEHARKHMRIPTREELRREASAHILHMEL